MPEAMIVDAVRTPIGRAFKGSLVNVRADDLAAIPIAALGARNPEVDLDKTVDVMVGCATQVGEQGYNLARNATLLAGIDHSVSATTVNRFCASSLQTARMAFHAIRAGEGEQFIAAGSEAVSRYPEQPLFDPNPLLDGSEGDPYDVYIAMGLTAENVARQCNVTREQQDEWAVISQQRAVAAQESGHYAKEIVPVLVGDRTVDRDDGPRPGTTMEKLAELQPAFLDGGTVTAGNACPLNDGAAAVLLMSDEHADRLGVRARARIVASTVAGVRPETMGLGPIPAIRDLLERASLRIGEIDIVEINEAFAAQVVACRDELGISRDQLNPFGGAIALGHPFGMSGARLLTSVLNGLETTGGRLGIASMCVGGGMGQAMLIERCD